MMKTSSATYGVIKLMNSTMAAISVFVAFVLGCLIVYASNFLMKRRKKEFGIYMLLGMEKGRIARIIMTETIIIGLVSLVLGLAVGIIASQGMSILVAKLFEADMTKYQFVVSYSAIRDYVSCGSCAGHIRGRYGKTNRPASCGEKDREKYR